MSNSSRNKSHSKKPHNQPHRDEQHTDAPVDTTEELDAVQEDQEDIVREESSVSDNTHQLARKIADLQASISVKDTEIQDWRDKAYRFSADLQNVTKQHEIDLQQASKRGKKSVVQTLLPFIDAMNLSFSYVPESDDEALTKFVTALKGSFEKMVSDFSNTGIEFLVPEEGDVVDTTYMSVLNASGDEEDVVVSKVVGVGVKIDGQLIQEATVMI
jgi:molecular chaperone GrpE (heat shock protein)